MEYDSILLNLKRHVDLNQTETDFFTSLLRPLALPKRAFLLREGEICRYENFVAQGCLRTYYVDYEGVEHIVHFSTEDWWTGDLYSFLTQTPARYYIEALEDSQLWQISKVDLDRLYGQVPKMERFFRIMLQNAYIAQTQRLTQNLSEVAETRYQHFLEKHAGLEQRVPQKYIASYLGITPEFLSMIRRKRTQKGIS
ncbi:MAG: Crp/Fnr family transcriptional regulator [Bacteroidota bacterium]